MSITGPSERYLRRVDRRDVGEVVIAALLDNPATRRETLELVGGDSPVAAAMHKIS